MKNDSDNLSTPADLALRIKAGDRQAEQELVQRYSKRLELILYRHCRDRSLVPDLRQETFILALEKLRDTGLDEPDKLAAYLHQIAINLATAEARTYYRRNTHPDWEFISAQADQEPTLLERLEREQLAQAIRQLLSELRVSRDQQILRRYYLTEEPKPSICQALGVSSEHFDRVLYRARQRFRELVERQLGKDFKYD